MFLFIIIVFICSSLISYILTAVSLPSSPPSNSLPPSTLPRSTPPLFPFRKGQASQGHQPNMAYQVVIRLGTCPHIEAGKATQWGWGGGKEPRTRKKSQRQFLFPPLGHPTRRPSYKTLTHMQKA